MAIILWQAVPSMVILTRVMEKGQTVSAPLWTKLSQRLSIDVLQERFVLGVFTMNQMTALRAEWLASLSDAIEGAQRVAWQLRTREGASMEARELYGRLEAARLELDSLRGVRIREGRSPDPDWVRALGWNSSLLDPAD